MSARPARMDIPPEMHQTQQCSADAGLLPAQRGGVRDVKDTISKRRVDPFELLAEALENGWQTIDTIPRAGEGEFLVITLTGLRARARTRSATPRIRRADGWGPRRTTVVACGSGNYLGAIAWRWPAGSSDI